jgi:hypothetical protein
MTAAQDPDRSRPAILDTLPTMVEGRIVRAPEWSEAT